MTAFVFAFIAALFLQASDALAADPSVMRVMAVPSAGQVSLVVEMSDEARRVSTQQTTATTLVLEAGPIAAPLTRQLLNAPSGLSLVQQVAVDEGVSAENEHLLRLRVTMKRPAPNSVRVVGRRIYIDFLVPDAPMPAAGTKRAAMPAAPAAAEPRQAADAGAFRQTMNGAASRFEQIQPFLVSAASSATPNPVVMAAVADAVGGLQQSLRGVRPPADGSSSLQLLTSAVSLAAEAVSTGFQGDRAAKAKQALAVFAAAKAQLQ